MKKTHYLSKELSIFEHKGKAACGIYVSAEKFGDNVSRNRQDVMCKNCLRSRIYRKAKNQQTCNKCGRLVGCDMNGRKHKCDCRK